MSRRPPGRVDRCLTACAQNPIVYYTLQALRWFPVVFITGVIVWGYYAYVIELCFNTVDNVIERVVYLVPAHILLVMFLWSYYATVFTPVGRPSREFEATPELVSALDEAPNIQTRAYLLDEFVRQRQLPITMRDFQGMIRYCEKCECLKPDRSHHCSICGHCVLKFDHHCPWVNSCVNYRNYKYFVQFLAYALLLCLYAALTDLQYFIYFWTDGNYSKKDAGKFHILFLFFASAMFAISVSTLFFYHLWLTAKNRSTIEQFRAPIFVYGEDKNGFNLGCRRNFREVFGDSRWQWILPTPSSRGDGYLYALPERLNEDAESCALLVTERSGNLAGTTSGDDDVKRINGVTQIELRLS